MTISVMTKRGPIEWHHILNRRGEVFVNVDNAYEYEHASLDTREPNAVISLCPGRMLHCPQLDLDVSFESFDVPVDLVAKLEEFMQGWNDHITQLMPGSNRSFRLSNTIYQARDFHFTESMNGNTHMWWNVPMVWPAFDMFLDWASRILPVDQTWKMLAQARGYSCLRYPEFWCHYTKRERLKGKPDPDDNEPF